MTVELRGPVAVIRLDRAAKRNSLSAELMADLDAGFSGLPDEVRVVVLAGQGDHFCSGLDLSEQVKAEPFQSVLYSRAGHALFGRIQGGGRPVVAALHGAVIGGGLELAVCAHVRVAETNAFYQLPEGRRGIYVGGGGSVRVARIIGEGRMTEMMLTGRRLNADEGHSLGLSHYLVEPDKAFRKALELAEAIADNAPISNYMMINVLGAVADMSAEAGLLTEAMAQAVTLTSDDAREGMQAFLQKRQASFRGAPGGGLGPSIENGRPPSHAERNSDTVAQPESREG